MLTLNRVFFWIKAARGYSFPMSIMSWSVPFLFGLLDGGNVLYGLISLAGIICAHAGVNLFDDFIDFQIEKNKNNNIAKFNFQKGKCEYLLNGKATELELFSILSVCFTLAFCIGIFLAIQTGTMVIYIMIAAAVISLLYPILSFAALGEIAVAIMFAPLLYTGVYFVMTQSFSQELMPVAVSTGLLTVGLLHAHMFLDLDFDIPNKKITLCRLAGSKLNAAKNQLIIMLLAYLNIIVFTFFNLSKLFLLSLFSLPTAIVLYKIMLQSIKKPNSQIKTNIFFGILENLQEYKKTGNLNFMITFMTARNVMVEFTMLICLAKILQELYNVHF